MVRCFALFSGGLDSALSIKHMKNLGVDVIALNFVSHFFGGPSNKISHMAQQLGVPVLFVNFHEHQLAATVHPVYGRGKNFNACIDCHATMINIAGQMMDKYKVDFIITGEVLGQRPMSQNMSSLQLVGKLSKYGDYLLRPMSGRLLPEVKANSLIPKDKLLDIQGRSVSRQMQLAKEYGITEYPSHAGGCQLTEPYFGNKMKQLQRDGVLTEECQFMFKSMRFGRLLRLAPRQYAIVGRNEESNKQLLECGSRFCSYISSPNPITNTALQLPGPTILLLDFTSIKLTELTRKPVQLTEKDVEDIVPGQCAECGLLEGFQPKDQFLLSGDELLEFGLRVYSHYCKGKGMQESQVEVWRERGQTVPMMAQSPAIGKDGNAEIEKCQVC